MKTIVFVLDENGPIRIEPWGWRGTEEFSGVWDAAPTDIAAELGRRSSREFDVHAVLTMADRKSIVLRVASSYAFTLGRGDRRWHRARVSSAPHVSSPPAEVSFASPKARVARARSR